MNMQQHPLISVIVPVYNMEKYLPKCLDSILGQTYKNLEIILVDDGSSDGSGDLCDRYAAKDIRIKVIHQNNKGVSGARNVGLDLASGEYIGFVDPDDYIAPKMYELLLKHILQDGADIATCGNVTLKPDGKRILGRFATQTAHLYTDNVIWLKDFLPYEANHVLWNKLFRKEIIGQVRLDETLVRGDDLEFLVRLFAEPLRITYFPHALYYYLVREHSIVHTKKIPFYIGEYTAWQRAFRIVKQTHQQHPSGVISQAWIKQIYVNFMVPKEFKLALLIILLDKEEKYTQLLKQLQNSFRSLYESTDKFPFGFILRAWIYFFGRYPSLTVHLPRLPGVRQMCYYYIVHR